MAQKSWAELWGVPGPQLAGQILKDAAGPCCPPHIPTRCPKESRAQGLEGKPGRVHALPALRSTQRAGRSLGGRAPCKQHPPSSRPTPGALRDGAALGRHPVDPGCSPSSRGCRKNFPGIKKKKKKNKEKNVQTGERRSKEVCGFFSSCVEPVLGVRGTSQWAHRCRTRNTTSEGSPPCKPPAGAASDVQGLLLRRQKSVHGRRHRLHVDLGVGRCVRGPEAGGCGGIDLCGPGWGGAAPLTTGGFEEPPTPTPQQGPDPGLLEERNPRAF